MQEWPPADSLSYEIVRGPPPEDFDSYAARVSGERMLLLYRDASEAEIQSFLERNPCLLPGTRVLGGWSSASPAHSVLISQPRLAGLSERRPDFMWLGVNSVACCPTLVEVERPSKRVFRATGGPSADFSQARHQLTQWKAWFSSPGNTHAFIADYNLDGYSHLIQRVVPAFILLYGRRSEFVHDVVLSRERSHLLDEQDEFLMSYDRLSVNPALSNVVTVTVKPNRRFQALAVQPTFRLGPVDAERLKFIDGLTEVIESTETIPMDRRKFLCSRLPYWIDWADRVSKGACRWTRGGDYE